MVRQSVRTYGLIAGGLLAAIGTCVAQGTGAGSGTGTGAGSGTGTGTPPEAPETTPESSGKPAEQGTEQAPVPGAVATPAPTPAPTPPPSFQFFPYFRSTLANAEGGRRARPFILPGAPAKYRLGNEPEHYGEFTFIGNHTLNNGMTLSAVTMVALNGQVNRFPFLADIDKSSNRSFAQAYVQATNVPGLEGARLWAGRIYYRRVDIHINDFFYWNPSGQGVGIENLKLGRLRYSYAFFDKEAGVQGDRPDLSDRHDFQVSGITTNANGELQLGLSYVQGKGSGSHNGWSLTAQHRQSKVLGGTFRSAVQYGVGPGSGYAGLAAQAGDITQDSSSRSFRVINLLTRESSPHFNTQVAAVYQHNRRTSDNVQEWISLGARPVYAFSDHFKLALEVGHDLVKPYTGDTRTLTKITLAPILSKGRGFYDRPELRFFVTYARWNEAAQDAADVGSALSTTGPYGNDRDGLTFGVHLEWW
jgi:maltoporin